MGTSKLWWRQVPIHLLFVGMLTACGAPGTPSQSVSGPDCRPEQVRDWPPPSQAPAAILTAPTFRHEALTGVLSWHSAGVGFDQEQPALTENTIPRRKIAVGIPLKLELDGEYFVEWHLTAYRSEDFFSDDASVEEFDWGEGSADPQLAFRRTCLMPPAAGDWILAARVTFADQRGQGRYYWHLVVGGDSS